MRISDWSSDVCSSDLKYPRRAITDKVLAPHVAEAASTAPSRVGELLSLAGVEKPMRALDTARGVAKGPTESDLDRITKRRDRIAHQGDRDGRSRAAITVAEDEDDITTQTAIVQALEQVLEACEGVSGGDVAHPLQSPSGPSAHNTPP